MPPKLFNENSIARGKSLIEKAKDKAIEDARSGKPMDPTYSLDAVGVGAVINNAYKTTYRKTIGGRRHRGRRHRKTRRHR